ncbi:MAG TPA: hypothetical protein VH478_17705, partial [Trebonia sp.]|nr:hypothetical protein [Trebonia sp.]
MSAGAVLAIVVICLLIALAAGAVVVLEVRGMLTHRAFGPEYERLARDVGPRRARAELVARKRRVAGLSLRPISTARARALAASFNSVQEGFVEDPARAAASASGLVLTMARERGYQAGDQERLLADLSVLHARRLPDYRRAQEATARAAQASTEELRQAMLAYRAMFQDLAGPGLAGGDGGPLAATQQAGPEQAGPEQDDTERDGALVTPGRRGGPRMVRGAFGTQAPGQRQPAPALPAPREPADRGPAGRGPAGGRPGARRPLLAMPDLARFSLPGKSRATRRGPARPDSTTPDS